VLRTHVMARADAAAIRRDAIATGMIPLREDGLAKARAGVTTEGEVRRVTQDAD
jgi:general secretion pathway protein E